jgi:alkylation response protein AidB-like acyl-CoA dehydrogenase
MVIAKTEDDGRGGSSQGLTTALVIDLPHEGWSLEREIATVSGSHHHCEIRIDALEIGEHQLVGERGQGYRLGQYR